MWENPHCAALPSQLHHCAPGLAETPLLEGPESLIPHGPGGWKKLFQWLRRLRTRYSYMMDKHRLSSQRGLFHKQACSRQVRTNNKAGLSQRLSKLTGVLTRQRRAQWFGLQVGCGVLI